MKKYLILAAAVTMFAACTNDTAPEQDIAQGERVPLEIGYSLGNIGNKATTRANTSSIQSTSLLNTSPNINTLGVFVLKKDQVTHTATEAYERINVASTSLTSNSPTTNYSLIGITGTDALVYPDNKSQEIDIYAYAPRNSSAVIADISSDMVTINTQTDQSTIANYMASDVLWGCAGTGANIVASASTSVGSEGPYELLKGTGSNQANNNIITANKYMTVKKNDADDDGNPDVTSDGRVDAYYLALGTPNTASVVVPMLHRGSKIIVNVLASGMIKDKLKNAVVKFNVDYTVGELNIATGEYKVPSGTAAPTATTPITLTDHLGIDAQGASPSPEGVTTVSTTDDAFTCSAVIVPQTISVTNDSGNGNIITIALMSDCTSSATETATYAFKLGTTAGATPPTFVSGKVYTYNITVTASGLSVTTTVADWVDGQGGTATSGSAELQ